MIQRFGGRVALVTGGAAGIGRAVVDRMVAEGATVVVWDINEERLASCRQLHAAHVLTQRVDVTDAGNIDRALSEAMGQFGRLDIVVNGAGLIGPNGPFWETTPEEWERTLRIDLTSVFLVSRAARPHLVANGWGRIINIASVTANEGPKNLAVYATSKAGVVGLTKSMAKDLAGTGVLVNAIAPALIATELLGQLTKEYYEAALSRIPLGRAGTLDEAAALITWLCSEECSFSTGAVYDLSGGRGV
ncbi:SDR family oxidoreductase [Paraburkholderia dipogonis]|uniref:SDR family oxidoreductase n=1 Tax=Paraburkholderia dipogonis TaxID=1211383 RepID=A0A4Y8MGE3_9BURK|nr:SDR family NAD(P)-dependent oxidoreductase [Paraburkholderia dipogonis]TFE36498.1 SDR family oxidoreductase [Paraburkholderia dipogonis]